MLKCWTSSGHPSYFIELSSESQQAHLTAIWICQKYTICRAVQGLVSSHCEDLSPEYKPYFILWIKG